MFETSLKFVPNVIIEKVTNGYVVTIERKVTNFFNPMVDAFKEIKKAPGDEWKDELENNQDENKIPQNERLVFRNYESLDKFLRKEFLN